MGKKKKKMGEKKEKKNPILLFMNRTLSVLTPTKSTVPYSILLATQAY